MRVIICGSPHWSHNRIVEDLIIKIRQESHINGKELLLIHGAEPGPETIALNLCNKIGIDQVIYPAQKTMGDYGFKRRNQIMLQEHKVDLVLVFAHILNENSVICDMLERANRKGIKIKPVDYESIAGKSSFVLSGPNNDFKTYRKHMVESK